MSRIRPILRGSNQTLQDQLAWLELEDEKRRQAIKEYVREDLRKWTRYHQQKKALIKRQKEE